MAERRPYVAKRRVLAPAPDYPTVSIPQSRTPIAPLRETFDFAAANESARFGALLVRAGQNLTDSIAREADLAAQEEGRREGFEAGSAGMPTQASGATIRGRAFNQAVLTSYADHSQLTMRQHLGQLAEQNPADPKEFREQARAWWEGFESELPVELKARLALSYDGLERQYAAAAQNRLHKQVKSESEASLLAMREQLGLDVDNAGRELWSDSQEAAEAAMRVLVDSHETLSERLSLETADGLPVFDPAQQVEQQLELQQRMLVSVARGFVDTASDKMAAFDSLQADGLPVDLGEIGSINLREAMPRETWEKTLSYARTRALQQRADTKRRAEGDARQRTLAAFRMRVAVERGEPDVTIPDIEAAVESGLFSDSEGASLVKTIVRKEEEIGERIEDAVRFSDAMSEGVPLDPKRKRDQGAVDEGFAAILGAAGIEDAFSDEGLAVVTEVAKRTTLLPESVRGAVRQLARHGDPERASQAAELVSRLEEFAPQTLTELSADEKAFALEVNQAVRAGVPAAEAVELVRNRVYTPRSAEREALAVQAKEMRRENPDALASLVDRDFDPSFFAFPPPTNPELQGDFDAATELYLQRTGNPQSARQAAWNDLKRVWGVTEVNGQREMMKYAPETIFGGARPGWVREQFTAELEALGLDPERHVMRSDPVTARRQVPDYQILEVDEFGVERPVISDAGELLRFRPAWDASPAAERLSAERELKIERLRAMRAGEAELERERFRGPSLQPEKPAGTPTPEPDVPPGSAL